MSDKKKIETWEDAEKFWSNLSGESSNESLDLMKQFFFTLGENAGLRKARLLINPNSSSWDTNPDRMGGQFTKEEIENTGWK